MLLFSEPLNMNSECDNMIWNDLSVAYIIAV